MKQIRIPKLDLFVNLLNQRTEREKQLIIGFMIALAIFLDYAVLVGPAIKAVSQDGPKIAPLKQELKGMIDDEKNKEEIRKKWEELKLTLETRDRSFISKDEIPALLENLSGEAQRSGVKIISLEPSGWSGDSPKGTYFPLPIEMRANAGAHEFGRFLSNLETGETFFRVKNIRIAANPQNEHRHQIDLSLEALKRGK